jgi:hypothetical protein
MIRSAICSQSIGQTTSVTSTLCVPAERPRVA